MIESCSQIGGWLTVLPKDIHGLIDVYLKAEIEPLKDLVEEILDHIWDNELLEIKSYLLNREAVRQVIEDFLIKNLGTYADLLLNQHLWDFTEWEFHIKREGFYYGGCYIKTR